MRILNIYKLSYICSFMLRKSNNKNLSGAKLSSFTPFLSKAEMKNFGFDAFISDVVEGPEVVLAHLCEVYRIHAVVSEIIPHIYIMEL